MVIADRLASLKMRLVPLLLTARQDAERVARQIWEMLLCDAWFEDEVFKIGKELLGIQGAPSEWIDDVVGEIPICLYEKLLRCPDLRFDPVFADESFGGWLRTIIWNFCRNGLERCRRLHSHFGCRPAEMMIFDPWEGVDARLDLEAVLVATQADRCEVLQLYLGGLSWRDIGARLNLPVSTAGYRLEATMRVLRHGLAAYRVTHAWVHDRVATNYFEEFSENEDFSLSARPPSTCSKGRRGEIQRTDAERNISRAAEAAQGALHRNDVPAYR